MEASTRQESGPTRKIHLRGLDAIRFLCAVIVVISHTGFPFRESLASSLGLFGKLFGALLVNLINPQAAVMVFFVVSGLCIHLPQVGAVTPSWPAFLARRYLRLGVPLLGAWLLGPLLSTKIFSGGNPVIALIWTLLLELIFYSAYPLLLLAVRRWGWLWVIALSLVLSGILLAVHVQVVQPGKCGVVGSAMIYLPVWLAGCHLAERLGTYGLPVATPFRVWGWRTAMLGASVGTSVLLYHASAVLPPVRYPASIIGVGFLASYWLAYEMARCTSHPPFGWLEWCGSWSYSLYLTHFVWFDVWIRLVDGSRLPGIGTPWEFFPRLAFMLALSILFYFVCERPSHAFARNAGRWLDRWDRNGC